MKRDGIASDNRRKWAAHTAQDEAVTGELRAAESIRPQALLACVLERSNLQRALKQVRRNKGAPGIDGMTVDDLPEYLRHHWPRLREQLIEGTYIPQPVRRVEIPKPDGKTRPLGIPTVLDRFIQQAMPKALRGAGSRAGYQRAMGAPLPPTQLRIPPTALGPSGRASRASEYPGRLGLGGGHGLASVL